MDSRTSSILINLDSEVLKNISSKSVASQYSISKEQIAESQKEECTTYKSLRQTLKECYLMGSARYGNNFIM